MKKHTAIDIKALRTKIKEGEITFGGNSQLKIYGILKCKSGKRMKIENRVFFASEKDALNNGYRPCAHCMKSQYQKRKDGLML
ncbi:MAG: Ada metal-binding domain-containing protein [Ginsengibacter sp.]